MRDLNSVDLTGRVVKDAQLSTSGKIAYTSLAVNGTRKNGDKYEDEASFVDIKILGEKQAETASTYLKKGKAIWIKGELKQETWEVEGRQQSRLVVIVASFGFLPLNKENNKETTKETPKSTPKEDKQEEKKEEKKPETKPVVDEVQDIPF